MDSPPGPDSDVAALRAELLASVAAIFDRAFEIGRRHGAEAVLATINTTARRLAGLSGSATVVFGASGTLTAVPAGDGDRAPALPPPAVKAGRAPSGYVQDAVSEVLAGSPEPLAPLQIVAVGKSLGHDLKASSVRMALNALINNGRVTKDSRGRYASLSHDGAAGSDVAQP